MNKSRLNRLLLVFLDQLRPDGLPVGNESCATYCLFAFAFDGNGQLRRASAVSISDVLQMAPAGFTGIREVLPLFRREAHEVGFEGHGAITSYGVVHVNTI